MRGSYLDIGLLLVRAATGLSLFALHGSSKLAAASAYLFLGQEWKFIRGVEALGFPLPAVFAIAAALAESLGAVGLAAGLLTRLSAAAVSFTMLVAVYRHLSAGENAELAFLYLIPALGIGLIGPGRYAIDSVLPALLKRESPKEHTKGAAAA